MIVESSYLKKLNDFFYKTAGYFTCSFFVPGNDNELLMKVCCGRNIDKKYVRFDFIRFFKFKVLHQENNGKYYYHLSFRTILVSILNN